MKKCLISLSALLISCLSYGQTSTYLGQSTVSVSHMIPHTEPKTETGSIIIKPNFKGKELMEETIIPEHYPDWVWQQHEVVEKLPTATTIWTALGLTAGVAPLDPTGDVDANVYMQAINGSAGSIFKTFNKTTGTAISGTLTMDGLGGPAGNGDPIVLFHKTAQKWIITEFSSTGNKLIVHVSQTSNPVGSYWTSTFTCTQFPDYPKYSIFESADALVVSTNEGGAPDVYAMKLSSLLTGATSPFIKTTIGYALSGFGFQTMTPVDLEGDNPAPTGMKPLFVRHRDDESHTTGSPDSNTNDWIELWEMTINWTNNTATVAKIQDISVTEFDSDLCGLTSFSCIGQPGTSTKLDPLREPIMFKVPMRVFSSHQAMVLAWTTDVNGSNRAGVRWVELRRASGVTTATWTKYQEGTYAPGTTTNRWMPGINMDVDGNILLAYSTSSTGTGDYPSLKYTGRKPCDPLGTMTIAETPIISGTSSKTSSWDTRWGDYHHMSIDPYLDNVFYFVGSYMNSGEKTRIAAIKINPDAVDASIYNVYQVLPGTVCGSTTTLGVVIMNKGTNALTSGVLQWQIGAGPTTNVNWTSSQLTTVGSLDTVFVTISGLVNGSNTVNFDNITANGLTPDNNDCNNNFSLTVTRGAGPGLTSSASVTTPPTCTPGNDGVVTLTVSGGTAPYTYSLNGGTGQTSNIFNNVPQGTATYIITDDIGCSGSGSIVVNTATIITVSPAVSSAILCNGNTNGAVTVTATGGTGSYTYSSNGSTYVGSNVFSGLGASSYTFYAKDGNGCTGSNTITVTQPTALTLNATPTSVTCFGANDGKIVAAASNGTPGYTYSIDGTNYGSSATFTGLAPGTYTVYAKDNNGCTKTFSTTIVQPTQVSVTGVGTVSNGTNGTITLTGSGGTTPYTYSINGSTYQSGSLFTGLAGGTYTLYIKDSKGCINTVVVKLQQVGIEELSQETLTLVNLFPNPTSGIVTLEVSGVQGAKLEIRVFNMNGQMVSLIDLPVNNGSVNQTIELSKKIAAGQYYMGIYDGTNTPIITKIVKQ